jgi:2-hydroxy-3-keto-5-methylthiopentenyl-1-phosphate phosphatase
MYMAHNFDSDNNLVIFSDFDGTVSTRDVGNRLFHHFSGGKSEEPVRRWKDDQIDSRQCLQEESELIDDLTEAQLLAFIDSFEIDPGFREFVDFCRTRQTPLYLLSDGLDLYIHRLLANNGLAGLPVLANQAWLENGRLQISWPYHRHTCGSCGNCKGYHIRRIKQPGQKAVYIGDGKSDLCALPEADIVFAKGYLAEYCRDHQIEFLPFGDFSAITDILKNGPTKSP